MGHCGGCAPHSYIAHVTGPFELGTVHHICPCGMIQYVPLLANITQELIPQSDPWTTSWHWQAIPYPICHTPIGVAGDTCSVLGKVRSLDSIGGAVPFDVLEGRGGCHSVNPELQGPTHRF